MDKTTTATGGTVCSLYAIRAGLSFAAQEKELVDRVVDAAKSKRDERLLGVKATEDQVTKTTDNARAVYEKAQQIESANLAVANYRPGGRYVALKITSAFLILLIIACVVAIAYAAVFWAVVFGAFKSGNAFCNALYGWAYDFGAGTYSATFTTKFIDPVLKGNGKLFYAVLAAATVLPVILAVVFGIIQRKIHKKFGVYKENFDQRKKARAVRGKLQAQTQKAGELYSAQLDVYNKVSAEIPQKRAEIDQTCRQECAPAVCHAVAASAAYKALEASYSGVMEAEDWEFLDGVIYAIEMNKATTVTEALAYLAKLQNVNKLEPITKLAEVNITRSVAAGLPKIKKDLKTALGALSTAIVKQAQSIAEKAQISVADQTAYTQKATDATPFNTALISKSTLPSTTLSVAAAEVSTGTRYIIDKINA